MAIKLTYEYKSIDIEYQIFRILPFELKLLIERSVYNRRQRKLFNHLEGIRKLLAHNLMDFKTIYCR
jgi:hypothetical protein